MGIVVNRELVKTLEESEIEVLVSRLTEIQKIEGNPMGVEICRFGNATAFSVKHIPGPSFNTVKGLQDDDKKQIDKILEFYKQKGIPVQLELTPSHVSAELLTILNEYDYYHHDFHTTLYAHVSNELEANNKLNEERITIRELKDDEFDCFAEIYTKGFQMPAFLKSGVAQNNEVLYKNKNWTFYLANYDGIPAGVGVLFIKDRIATLAAAATLPSLRNKGIHRALIKHRISQATLQNCDLIAGQAKFASISQNNMERAGLRIAYIKALWKEI